MWFASFQKEKPEQEWGDWSQETIRWQTSAKEEQFFKNQDYSERVRRGGRPFIPGEV